MICKATASKLKQQKLLPSPSKKWKEYFARQRIKTEKTAYYLSAREAAHFKKQSMQVLSFTWILKFLQGIMFSDSGIQFLFSNYFYLDGVFTYFSTFTTCLNTNCQSLLHNSSCSFKTFQWEHTQRFHCTFLYNTGSKHSSCYFSSM